MKFYQYPILSMLVVISVAIDFYLAYIGGIYGIIAVIGIALKMPFIINGTAFYY